MKRCRYCHRPLKDAESIKRGFGPVCFDRVKKRPRRRKKLDLESLEENMTIGEWYESQKGSDSNESSGIQD